MKLYYKNEYPHYFFLFFNGFNRRYRTATFDSCFLLLLIYYHVHIGIMRYQRAATNNCFKKSCYHPKRFIIYLKNTCGEIQFYCNWFHQVASFSKMIHRYFSKILKKYLLLKYLPRTVSNSVINSRQAQIASLHI